MAKTEQINIRIEPKLKKEVEETLSDLGMNIADAVTIFFKQIIIHDGIPFEIRRTRFSNEMIKAIKEGEIMEKHPEKYKSFDNINDFMEDLHSEIQDRKNK